MAEMLLIPNQAVVQPARVEKSTLQVYRAHGSVASANYTKGILWTGVAVSLSFYIFRIWVRVKIFRRLFPDDAFVLAAWLMATAYAAIWQWCGSQLYISIAVASGKLLKPPPDILSQVKTFLRGLFVAYVLFYTCLWCIKLSFLLFYWKFVNHVRRQRILWWAVLVFTVASYAVCLGLVDYSCLLGSVARLASKQRHHPL